jgi:hypothetical protein
MNENFADFETRCGRAGYAVSGLIQVAWSVSGEGPGLEVQADCVSGDEISEPVTFDANRPADSRWFAVNTHLLPNGGAAVRARLLVNGQAVSERVTNLLVNNEGALAEKVRASLKKSRTPLIIDQPCDTQYYDYGSNELVPWFDNPNAFKLIDALVSCREITNDEAGYLREFVTKGFCIVPDVVTPEHLAAINKDIDDAIQRKYQDYVYGTSARIQGLHEHYRSVRELWLHPGVMRLLRLIFRDEPSPCQSLTFVFGSQQDMHQDGVFLTPFPAGYMCGVWVALQDVQPDSGELVVYPGSHRLPRVRMSEAGGPRKNWGSAEGTTAVGNTWQRWISEGKFEEYIYRPRQGSVLIWHENLMHGGSKRRDESKERRSIVSHYFASGGIAFYDAFGQVGHIEPRERMTAQLPTA